MVGLINKRLIPVVLAEAGIIDLKRQAASLSGKEKEAIAEILQIETGNKGNKKLAQCPSNGGRNKNR